MFTKPIIIEPRTSNRKTSIFWNSLPRTYDPTMYPMPKDSRFAWELAVMYGASVVLTCYAVSTFVGWV